MPEFREDRVGSVIERFYEAALRPDLWRAALQDYADAVGAEGALILPGPKSAVPPTCSEGLDEAVAVGLRDGWFSDNPRLGRGIPALTNLQGVLVESHIFTPEELDSIPFNADFAGRQGLRWFAGIYLAPEGQRSIMLSAERRTGQEMFSHREVALIAAMVPHLQRAGRMALHLAEARAESMLDAFELMRCGCLLLDSTGRVIRLNDRARAELGGALQVLHGNPVAAGSSANAALGRLIGSVLHGGRAHEAAPLPAVAIPRPGRPPLVVHAAPILASARDVFQSARALLLITDPAARSGPADALLAQGYGLTAAEIRLVQDLARDRDLAEIATRSGVAVATLRSQLKTVFAKTGTHRQSELVNLVSRLSLRA